MNAMKPVYRIELRAAKPAKFQQHGVAAFVVFLDPIFNDGPRLTDAAAVENEPMGVPQVPHHRRAPQLRGATRASHAYPGLEFRT